MRNRPAGAGIQKKGAGNHSADTRICNKDAGNRFGDARFREEKAGNRSVSAGIQKTGVRIPVGDAGTSKRNAGIYSCKTGILNCKWQYLIFKGKSSTPTIRKFAPIRYLHP